MKKIEEIYEQHFRCPLSKLKSRLKKNKAVRELPITAKGISKIAISALCALAIASSLFYGGFLYKTFYPDGNLSRIARDEAPFTIAAANDMLLWEKPEVKEPESPSAPPASVFLTADEAIELYDDWLENHDKLAAYILNREYYQQFELFGEMYFQFSAAEPSFYWYNILVHMETGHLLFLMTSDGEHPVTSIELLDDWYMETFAP